MVVLTTVAVGLLCATYPNEALPRHVTGDEGVAQISGPGLPHAASLAARSTLGLASLGQLVDAGTRLPTWVRLAFERLDLRAGGKVPSLGDQTLDALIATAHRRWWPPGRLHTDSEREDLEGA